MTTQGFEWNLGESCSHLLRTCEVATEQDLRTFAVDGTESSFNGLFSTSNHVIADQLWIETSAPIVWTVEVRLPVDP